MSKQYTPKSASDADSQAEAKKLIIIGEYHFTPTGFLEVKELIDTAKADDKSILFCTEKRPDIVEMRKALAAEEKSLGLSGDKLKKYRESREELKFLGEKDKERQGILTGNCVLMEILKAYPGDVVAVDLWPEQLVEEMALRTSLPFTQQGEAMLGQRYQATEEAMNARDAKMAEEILTAIDERDPQQVVVLCGTTHLIDFYPTPMNNFTPRQENSNLLSMLRELDPEGQVLKGYDVSVRLPRHEVGCIMPQGITMPINMGEAFNQTAEILSSKSTALNFTLERYSAIKAPKASVSSQESSKLAAEAENQRK